MSEPDPTKPVVDLEQIEAEEQREKIRNRVLLVLIALIGCAIAFWVGTLINANQEETGKAQAQTEQAQVEKFNLAQQIAAACADPNSGLDPAAEARLCTDATTIVREGPEGAQGIPGIDGIDGRDGKDGKQGVQGIQGVPGKDSTVPGPPGPAGKDSTVPGPPGEQGPRGADGTPGTAGADGTDGKDGAQGPPGENAYPFTFTITGPPDGPEGDTTYTCTKVTPESQVTCASSE